MLGLSRLIGLGLGLGLFGTLLVSLPIRDVSGCYCAIGPSQLQPPTTIGTLSNPAAKNTWVSPATLGTTPNPASPAFLNGFPKSTTGLVWDLLAGNAYGNVFRLDNDGTGFNTVSIASQHLPTSVNTFLSTTNNQYTANGQTYALNETLTGCSIPTTAVNFTTSFQFQPYYYDDSTVTYSQSNHPEVPSLYVYTPTTPNGVKVPILNDGLPAGGETFYSSQFQLGIGINTIYLPILITDVAAQGGCPFVYRFNTICCPPTQIWTGTACACPSTKPVWDPLRQDCKATGVNGDPQFTGFLGQSYQVHGQSDAFYNIISSPTLQFNAHFVHLTQGECRVGTPCFSHPGNYFGAVGLKLRDESGVVHTIYIKAGSVDTGLTVTIGDISLEVSDHEMSIGKYVISYPSPFMFLLESDEFNIEVQNSDHFLNQDVSLGVASMKNIKQYKALLKTNETAAEEMEPILPHGILGQTWGSRVHNNRWKHIEGQLYDYLLTDGIMGDAFKYNKF